MIVVIVQMALTTLTTDGGAQVDSISISVAEGLLGTEMRYLRAKHQKS